MPVDHPQDEIAATWSPPGASVAFYRRAGYWRGASIVDELRTCAERFPDRVAVQDSTSRLTFGELAAGARAFAQALRSRGLLPGQAVVVQLPNWTEAAVVFHGVLMAGGVVVPVTPIMRRREVGFILRQTTARVAVVAESFRSFDFAQMYDELRGEVSSLEHVVHVRSPRPDSLAAVLAAAPPEELAPRRHGDDVAAVIYTSGTTADPKGALHTHDGLLASTRICGAWFGLNENDVLFNPSPVSHITGISLSFLFPVAFGCSTVLQETWDPEAAFDAIARERVTFTIFATPFLAALADIADRRHVQLDHVRTIVCGGADVPETLARRAFMRLGEIVRMYGATEAPNVSSGSPWDPQAKKWGTEGRWMFPVEARVVDPQTLTEVPAGEVGEVVWRAPQMCRGYLDAGLNDASFTPDGWFKTGDLARIDEEGYVTVSGRIKDIINRGGEKFSSREIEDLLHGLPEIADVAVTPMSDAVLGEKVCAWVVLRDGVELSLEQVCGRLLAEGLAKQKLPQRLMVVDVLPRTPSGKVKKHELRARVDALLTG